MQFQLFLNKSQYSGIIYIIDEKNLQDSYINIPKLPSNSIVIFRLYENLKRYEYAKSFFKISKLNNHKFLISKDLELKNKIKSDGLHIPNKLLNKNYHKKLLKNHELLSISAHSEIEIIKAIKFNPDFILFSKAFYSSTHIDNNIHNKKYYHYLCCKYSKYNISALGGVSFYNIKKLKNHKIKFVAGISIFN